MTSEPEFDRLRELCDELTETRGLVTEILEDRDAEIIRLAREGIPKGRIADIAGVAKISIYKILGSTREKIPVPK